MRLLIDIGNTRLKWAPLSAGRLGTQRSLGHRQGSLTAQLEQEWGALPRPAGIHLVSVAASETSQAVIDWLSNRWQRPVEVLQSVKQAAGVVNGYTRPERLGADRWAAMIGAYALVNSAVCVFDCGTALTCDAIDSAGNHLGGVIAPGQALMRSALLDTTAGIQLRETVQAAPVWGTDTDSCVAAGWLHSAIGLMERMLKQLQSQSGAEVAAVVTGGDAEALLPELTFPCRYEADLVLQGLARIVSEQES